MVGADEEVEGGDEVMNLAELSDYVRVLIDAAATTTRTEDRPMYQAHLAAAACLFVAVRDGDMGEVQRLVSAEDHAYGWSYLSGAEGERTHAAWATFSDLFRQ